MRFVLLTWSVVLTLISTSANTIANASMSGSTPLSLEDYLGKVREKNEGFQGAKQVSQGALERAPEAELIYAPSFFSKIAISEDARQTVAPFFQGTKTVNDSFSLGVAKNTDFGLQAKLSYNFYYNHIFNASTLPMPMFYDSMPTLDLTQSLWRNWAGSEKKATADAQNAQTLQTSFTQSFTAKNILSEAEIAYWKLSLARSTIEIQEQTLDRAKKILDWASRRVNNDLADKADKLAADAAFQLRALELQAARDEEQAACRAFNSFMGLDSNTVEEKLLPLEQDAVEKLQIPAREKMRDDVKAAEQAQRLTQANAELVRQRVLPSLELSTSLSLNAKNTDWPTAVSNSVNSFGWNHPWFVVKMDFNMPLDFGMISDARQGALIEQKGAELLFRRKLFEQEREWQDLTVKLEQAKYRLGLNTKIENIQKEKVNQEKRRMERGRSTAYQVLLMEQDYLTSRVSRVKATGDVVTLFAKLKLFGGSL